MGNCSQAEHYKFHSSWTNIAAPLSVIEWITSGVRLHFTKEPKGFVLPNHLLSANQEAFVTQEINDLLKSGAIEECLEQPLCVSPIGSACQKRTASFG